jgi:hypothetical protein
MLCSLLFTALIIKAIVREMEMEKNDTKQLKLVFLPSKNLFCLGEFFNHTIKKTEIHKVTRYTQE